MSRLTAKILIPGISILLDSLGCDTLQEVHPTWLCPCNEIIGRRATIHANGSASGCPPASFVRTEWLSGTSDATEGPPVLWRERTLSEFILLVSPEWQSRMPDVLAALKAAGARAITASRECGIVAGRILADRIETLSVLEQVSALGWRKIGMLAVVSSSHGGGGMTEDGKMRDLDVAIATMRAMSKCTEPQEVVRLLQQFVNHVTPADRCGHQPARPGISVSV